jgi:sialate O-acetylesterase
MRLLAKAYHKLLSKLFWVITVALLLQACGISNHTPPLPPNETDTTFYVANILQSNMVVQRNKPFTLWGRANAGDKISVTVSWNTGPVTAITSADNKWEAVIPASAANNNAQIITIKADNRPAIIFNNILIGDVWLCSGQSNMAMPVAPDGKLFEGVTDYANEVATANYPLIRVCTIETDRQAQPLATFKSKPEWTVCSPTTVGKLSATGYYFARKLQTELNVPVGIIVSAVNDEGCSLWVNHEVFSADSTFAAIFGGGRASQLYNGMINPLIKLQLTGILWYQGENNLTDIPDRYAMLNTALINGWRKQFNQGMLPFIWCSLHHLPTTLMQTTPTPMTMPYLEKHRQK